ncbi:MAG TPA: glycosyltransferase [Bryobacteraceae bacterium]|jgi:glycosyltransferase involved in cell wall biosynthesis
MDQPILMVIDGDIATTQLVERLLLACQPFGVRYTTIHFSSLSFRHLDGRTVPLFVRCGEPGLPVWIDLLRRANHPYLYYIDDNFWELQGDSPVALYYRDPGVRTSLECALKYANQVLTNSEVLASYLQRFSNHIRVVPPFFDFALIEGCVREQTPELRIGFAGSTTRTGDLELLKPVIETVLDRVPNAIFEFCGVMPAGIQAGRRVRYFEHTSSYADFIRFQARRNWAIGLAPLRDHSANRAKTNNKYREYGACGIAGIYSDIPPYNNCVEDSVTGLLVGPSEEAWLSAILRLALQSDERRQIASHAESDVRRKYSVTAVAHDWGNCIREAHIELQQHPSKLRLAWTVFVLRRIPPAIRIYGLQVQDAYRKGGFLLVVSKAAERFHLRRPGLVHSRDGKDGY